MSDHDPVDEREESVDEMETALLGPRAKDFFQFSVYDSKGEHIVTLRLKRKETQTIGDMAQLQNFLWTQVGFVIRDNKDLQHTLALGGIEVLLEDPRTPFAPASAS